MNMKNITIGTLLVLAVALPSLVYPVFLMQALCFALFACAFNLLIGYTGLVSFGHAAFFALSGYVCAYAAKIYGLGPVASIAIGTAAGAVLGAIMGAIAIRRTGIYFSMITLALAQLVYFYLLQAPWTGAEDGLQGIPRGRLLGFDLENNLVMYYFVLVICVTAFAGIYRVIHSPFGQVLSAIRDNEPRATSLGYDVNRFKLLGFVLSATVAGLAGALKVLSLQLASLADAHWHMSGEVILMTILGGMGTMAGPVVGAIFVTSLHHYLAGVGSWIVTMMGAIFICVVMLFREGMVGYAEQRMRRWRNRTKTIEQLTKKEI